LQQRASRTDAPKAHYWPDKTARTPSQNAVT
jgi:hypothetical protein